MPAALMPKLRKIDYKKELEAASKGMIMIHEPKLLIKLIVRNIVSKVKIKHSGMILYEPDKDAFVLSISRGETGVKIPAGFARFDKNHAIIKLFTEKKYRAFTVNKSAIQSHDLTRLIWQEHVLNGKNGLHNILYEVGDQMDMLNVVACVPAYYRKKLLAILLLGQKEDESPFDQEELDFFAALASDTAMAIRNAQLFMQLRHESEKNHDLFLRTTMALGQAIEAKDKYTHGHTQRVTDYAHMIAKQMVRNGSANFNKDFFESLYVASMLHDIGKIGVPEQILNKNGTLTEEEYRVVQKHPVHGVEILAPLSELKESLDGVKYHHERYDGKGYPYGIKGDAIPLVAAVISVADAFDAMITDRPYRKGKTVKQAVQEIKEKSGTQFHPLPVQAMAELYAMGAINPLFPRQLPYP